MIGKTTAESTHHDQILGNKRVYGVIRSGASGHCSTEK
jgi:hypothetical protein